jgi:hypothetical protein
MKKRTGVLLFVVALVGGIITGYFTCFYQCSCGVGRLKNYYALDEISSLYIPLKYLREGETEKAAKQLRFEMHYALQAVDALGSHTPDILTNSVVISGRTLDKD